ncbi:MAG: ester cyclase, partial [Gaiellaceae bacterium]
AFPDLRVETEWMISDGDLVVQRSRMTGTHRGRWFGAEPTGKRAEWSAIEVYRIDGGRIAEQWLSEDWTSVLQQLGALPAA